MLVCGRNEKEAKGGGEVMKRWRIIREGMGRNYEMGWLEREGRRCVLGERKG